MMAIWWSGGRILQVFFSDYCKVKQSEGDEEAPNCEDRGEELK